MLFIQDNKDHTVNYYFYKQLYMFVSPDLHMAGDAIDNKCMGWWWQMHDDNVKNLHYSVI